MAGRRERRLGKNGGEGESRSLVETQFYRRGCVSKRYSAGGLLINARCSAEPLLFHSRVASDTYTRKRDGGRQRERVFIASVGEIMRRVIRLMRSSSPLGNAGLSHVCDYANACARETPLLFRRRSALSERWLRNLEHPIVLRKIKYDCTCKQKNIY